MGREKKLDVQSVSYQKYFLKYLVLIPLLLTKKEKVLGNMYRIANLTRGREKLNALIGIHGVEKYVVRIQVVDCEC